jgi:hypothetical protein
MSDKATETAELLSYLNIGDIARGKEALEGAADPAPHLHTVKAMLPSELALSFDAGMAELLEEPTRAGELVEALQQRLQQDPEATLAAAPAVLGPSPTQSDGSALLDEVRRSLAWPELTLQTLKANRAEGAAPAPPPEQFPGRDDVEIPIHPGLRKLEEGDAPAWALTAAYAWGFRITHSKPLSPPHTVSSSDFRYPLQTVGDKATVALFSDWGSGYYHSQYITKHVAALGAQQAVHLGDVYYTGTQQEFRERFEPFLDKYILKRMPFYAMNANHEMDTHGIAYFAHLRRKREQGGKNGYVPQPQEGSYFCLANAHYQVIGIDTAYWRNGRCKDDLGKGCAMMREWLEQRLLEGRAAGRVNILLSQNEPYEMKRNELLADLDFVLRRPGQGSLVDLWFWGDQHYGALYPPTEQTPFIGSCIGHGGYPYPLKTKDWFARHFVKPAWAETAPRFEQRPDRGNNGFCLLEAEPGRLRLRYIDWRRNERCTVDLPVVKGRLDWTHKVSAECERYAGP